MREANLRKDPLTKEDFIAKRVNQKFAKPENRIKFYNRGRADSFKNIVINHGLILKKKGRKAPSFF